jgi:hypothetical protein
MYLSTSLFIPLFSFLSFSSPLLLFFTPMFPCFFPSFFLSFLGLFHDGVSSENIPALNNKPKQQDSTPVVSKLWKLFANNASRLTTITSEI